MPQPRHVKALYLPRVAAIRAQLVTATDELLAELGTTEAMLGFLLEYCAMRIGPLRPIPSWLVTAAREAALAGHELVAAELRLAATREREHRLLLVEDLVALRETWNRRVDEADEIDLRALVQREPEAATQRHAKLRELAAADPLAMIATELELAELGRTFGPALVAACQATLGDDAQGCLGFVRARAEDAQRRADVRLLRLDALLVEQPEQARSWAAVSSTVISSYVDALWACTGRGVRLTIDPAPSGWPELRA